MNSVAGSNWNDVLRSSSSPRADDDELGQRIALALRERRPTMDFEPLLAGRYRVEGRISVDEHVERYDANRVADGRWVTIEMPIEEVGVDPGLRERFIRSARLQCRLRHPHVMYALEHGVGSDGRPYLVREALDMESLATLVAREGSVTWTRARSIALQLCNAVTAAREHDLVPADLSLDRCHRARHGRALDDIRLAQWALLEGMTPEERDERAAVFAIGRIVEDLVAGNGPDGQVGTHPSVVSPPPAELSSVLARTRSLVPSARYASVEQLGIAIAAIDDDLVGMPSAPHDDTTYAVHVPAPRRRSRPIEQPAEITCTTAAVLATPTTQAAASVAEPQVRSRRVIWPWIGLAAVVGVSAVYLVAPKFWPGVADRARDGIDTLRDAARGREALDVPPAPLAVASIAAAPSTTLADPLEPSPPAVSVDAMPMASGVIMRSVAVPPAPSLATPSPRAPAKARAKARTRSRPPAAVSEHELTAIAIDVIATPEVSEPTMPTSTTLTPPANDPPTDTPPRQEPPTDTPPVTEPPREIDDPDAPTPIEGDAAT